MEHYKITHFYANNKQSTDNKAIPIGDYPPEDIQNVSKKVILNPKNHERCNPPFIAHPYKKSPT